MLRRSLSLLSVVVVALSCDDDGANPTFSSPPGADSGASACQGKDSVIDVVPALGDAKFDTPVEMVEGPGRRFYVVELGGKIKVVSRDGGPTTTALDISKNIVSGGEAGLLGLAFDPGFATNGFVYLYFTAKLATKPDIIFQDVVVRMASSDGGATFDASTQKILIQVDDPYNNHNGGKIAFGPDGFLYIAMGDGGSGGDPKGNGQNKNVLLGKILRIDPKGGDPYGVPADNPFVGDSNAKPEVWAYGLRNPWKFSFDREGGTLWCGDVGQGTYEEVDIIVRGGNYGWNEREGKHCFGKATCATEGLLEPVVEYNHDLGLSITGGYVYRGTKIPALVGRYVYGDYGTGTIWSVKPGEGEGAKVVDSGLNISSFGQDSDGEIYVADHGSGTIKMLALRSVAVDGGAGCPDSF